MATGQLLLLLLLQRVMVINEMSHCVASALIARVINGDYRHCTREGAYKATEMN